MACFSWSRPIKLVICTGRLWEGIAGPCTFPGVSGGRFNGDVMPGEDLLVKLRDKVVRLGFQLTLQGFLEDLVLAQGQLALAGRGI